MASTVEIDDVWKQGKSRETIPAPLAGKDLQAIIASRVRKELKTVSEFVWAAIVYQIILYSFLTHTLIRHWGDVQIIIYPAGTEVPPAKPNAQGTASKAPAPQASESVPDPKK